MKSLQDFISVCTLEPQTRDNDLVRIVNVDYSRPVASELFVLLLLMIQCNILSHFSKVVMFYTISIYIELAIFVLCFRLIPLLPVSNVITGI